MDRLFVDSSAWYAYANKSEPDHSHIRRVLREFQGRLVTSNFVFDEAVTLAARRAGHASAVRIGDTLIDGDVVDLVRLDAADERKAWKLFRDRSDKSYSFTDCTSFVLMRRLGLKRAASLDEAFRQEGFVIVPGG